MNALDSGMAAIEVGLSDSKTLRNAAGIESVTKVDGGSENLRELLVRSLTYMPFVQPTAM